MAALSSKTIGVALGYDRVEGGCQPFGFTLVHLVGTPPILRRDHREAQVQLT